MQPESVDAFIRYPRHVPLRCRPCDSAARAPANGRKEGRKEGRKNGHANGHAYGAHAAGGEARSNGDAATAGGICFATGERLEAGELVRLTVSSPRGAEDFTAKVAWSQPEDGVYLTAVRLLDENDAYRARLVAQLCLIDAYRRTEQAGGRDLDDDTAASEWIARYAHRVPAIG